MLEKLFDGVIWAVGLVRKRPKLLVEYQPLRDMSTAVDFGTVTVRWPFRVTITNLATEDALEVTVLESSMPELRELPEHHIRALDRLVVERTLRQDLDLKSVIEARQAGGGRLPEPAELSNLRLVLAYRSNGGPTFYTDYLRSRAARPNQWSRRRPHGAA